MVLELTTEQFGEEVLQAEGLVLVDFYADWCGPCKVMEPVVEKIGDRYHPQLKAVMLNVDRNMEIAQKYRVVSVPTLLFFKNGEIMDISIGVIRSHELEELIWRNL